MTEQLPESSVSHASSVDEARRRCVVVLGSGRSGTSAIMRVLYTLGFKAGGELTAESEQNPEGSHEETEIVRCHLELMAEIGGKAFFPLPEGWERSAAAAHALASLRTITEARLRQTEGKWAFKDPRTATFLPLWIRIFNLEKIVPIYILAVREPSAVIASMWNQYMQDPTDSEAIWLLRNISALCLTGGRIFTAHYESLLRDPEGTVRALASYCNVDASDECINASVDAVRPEFDRASVSVRETKLRATARLYDALKGCNGHEFNRDALLIATEINDEINEYRPWLFRSRSDEPIEPRSKTSREIAALQGAIARLEETQIKLLKDAGRQRRLVDVIEKNALVDNVSSAMEAIRKLETDVAQLGRETARNRRNIDTVTTSNLPTQVVELKKQMDRLQAINKRFDGQIQINNDALEQMRSSGNRMLKDLADQGLEASQQKKAVRRRLSAIDATLIKISRDIKVVFKDTSIAKAGLRKLVQRVDSLSDAVDELRQPVFARLISLPKRKKAPPPNPT